MVAADSIQCSKNAAGFVCPVCDAEKISELSPGWKNYHDEKKFFWSDRESFVQCDVCGTVFRAPLQFYSDFKKYGEDYYNQVNQGETAEQHAVWHFQNFQKFNYDALHKYMLAEIPPQKASKWLDVGSIGYATTLPRYDFRTIEPDQRIVRLGRQLFRKPFSFFRKPKIECATIETYSSPEKFDGILFNNSFYCLTTPLAALRKAADLLRPRGELLISISTYFNDAVAVRTDGMLSRIEDVLQGETLWVFYNRFSLEYLCRKAGFEFESETEVGCYGKKTMRVYRFVKAAGTPDDADLLRQSREKMTGKLKDCFDGFKKQTANALTQINDERCFVFGTAPVICDALNCGPLDRVAGVVLFETAAMPALPAGIRIIGMDEVRKIIAANDRIRFKIAVLSFKYQDEIFAKIRDEVGDRADILKPNRKSGMEQLFFDFKGQKTLCKGLFFGA